MEEGGGGEALSALSLFRSHLSSFPPETPYTQASYWPDMDNEVEMLLVVCQLGRDVIGYKDAKYHWCVSIRLLSQLTVVYC